jgi:hypothetical protein
VIVSCALVLLAADPDEALAAAKVAPVATARGADVRVFATLPAARTAAVAAAAQKAFATALAALKRDKSPWDEPLTVYALADARQTRQFILVGLKQSPGREAVRTDVAVPYVLVGVGPGEKRADAQWPADVAAQVAGAVLLKSAGPEVPGWLRVGFGRAVQAKADGPKAVAALRKRYPPLAATLTPADVWADDPKPDADLRATAVVDYLAFGPGADKFDKFLAALKPTDDNPRPTAPAALEAAGMKPDGLATGLRAWLRTGK